MVSIKSKLFKYGLLLATVVVSGVVVNNYYQTAKLKKQKHEQLTLLIQEVDKKRSSFVKQSFTRSQAQQNLLDKFKRIDKSIQTALTESNNITFQKQTDFNDYEKHQNQVQKVLMAQISVAAKSKLKKEIDELEWSDKILNEARLNYSAAEVELSKLQNRTPVTFLSDVELLQSQNIK